MAQYLALLRGINVGGKNIIKMADLRACFEGMGFSDVITYIQSGNVIFNTPEDDEPMITRQIEKSLAKRFSYDSKIVLVSYLQLKTVAEEAPDRFGILPGEYKYDVIFLRGGLTLVDLINRITVKEGVDSVHAGTMALYFSRLTARRTQSRLKNIMGLPEYQNMTIRTWNTVSEILKIMTSN